MSRDPLHDPIDRIPEEELDKARLWEVNPEIDYHEEKS
jgi:hypothetical protein